MTLAKKESRPRLVRVHDIGSAFSSVIHAGQTKLRIAAPKIQSRLLWRCFVCEQMVNLLGQISIDFQ